MEFEYKTVVCSLPGGISDFENELNELGEAEWELVSVCPSGSSEYGLDSLTAFLKREKLGESLKERYGI